MRIQPTHIVYQDRGTPVSAHFDDVYFIPENGIEESLYVYLEGIRLRERLVQVGPEIQLAEIGFGLGLNFLLTLREFETYAHAEQCFTYFSAEKYPVFEEDLRSLYSRFPELEPYAKLLLDQYPILTPGFHTLSFFGGRFKLILMLGDATEMFTRLDAKIEFWYWDGFSPSKNPDSFSEKLFDQVARLSAENSQGASYTAAGWVRKIITQLGFKIEKRPGFLNKRECISATFEKTCSSSQIIPAWFSRENLKTIKKGDSIAVVGAGLSGTAIARVLADQGYSITVFDQYGVAKRASGNSVGLYNVQLSKLPNPISRFSQLALVHFIRELKFHGITTKLGIFRVGEDIELAMRACEYPDTFYRAETRDGQSGFLFPYCGIISPKKLCESRLKHKNIELIQKAVDAYDLAAFDHVVYTVGADLVLPRQKLENEELKKLPVRSIRGQTIEVAPTKESEKMVETWINDGYVSPVAPEVTGHPYHLIGATYQAKTIADDQESIDCSKLLADVKNTWQCFQELSPESIVSHRVGHRLSTPDKLPMIGPVCDTASMQRDYSRAFRGNPIHSLPKLSVHPGQWMMLGMGSRGITYSSLSAEILAALMTGKSLPIELDLWEHLHSARFSIRNLKRNEVS